MHKLPQSIPTFLLKTSPGFLQFFRRHSLIACLVAISGISLALRLSDHLLVRNEGEVFIIRSEELQ